jgi:protein TonB
MRLSQTFVAFFILDRWCFPRRKSRCTAISQEKHMMDTEPDIDRWGILTDSGADWRFVLLSVLAHLLILSLFIFYGSSLAVRHSSFTEEKCVMVTLSSLTAPGGDSKASGGEGKPEGGAAGRHSEKPAAVASAPPVKKAETPHHKAPHKVISPKSTAMKPVSVATRAPKVTPHFETQTPSEVAATPSAPEAEATASAVASAEPVSGNTPAPSSSMVSGGGNAAASSASSGSGHGAGSGNGTASGSGNGSGNGRGNGSGNGVGSIESSFGAADGPRFLRRVMPHFPRVAQFRGLEGTVVLRLTLDKSGRLVNIEVVSGAGNGFDEAAIQAARDSTFSPAQKNGMPVACKAVLPVRFQLTSNG